MGFANGLNEMANYRAKGCHKVLCPYYIREYKKTIKCVNGFRRFEDEVSRTEWRNHHCYKYAPINCDWFLDHWEKIKKGEEPKLPPRANARTRFPSEIAWQKRYHEWKRNNPG